ncbi:MAG TPA: hypothetical protein VK631_15730, partial [Solirubrobacteraceae bacterium]|nr:hypothetical protein [Solirubrobacteraceae bacterium]
MTAATNEPSARTAVPDVEQHLQLIVADHREIAAGVVCLELTGPDGARLPAWSPGAHIDLVL